MIGDERGEDISHQPCVCVFGFLKDSWCAAVPTTNINLVSRPREDAFAFVGVVKRNNCRKEM